MNEFNCVELSRPWRFIKSKVSLLVMSYVVLYGWSFTASLVFPVCIYRDLPTLFASFDLHVAVELTNELEWSFPLKTFLRSSKAGCPWVKCRRAHIFPLPSHYFVRPLPRFSRRLPSFSASFLTHTSFLYILPSYILLSTKVYTLPYTALTTHSRTSTTPCRGLHHTLKRPTAHLEEVDSPPSWRDSTTAMEPL